MARSVPSMAEMTQHSMRLILTPPLAGMTVRYLESIQVLGNPRFKRVFHLKAKIVAR
jgi:hypothetical protein